MIDYSLQFAWQTIVIIIIGFFMLRLLKEIRDNTKKHDVIIKTISEEKTKEIIKKEA